METLQKEKHLCKKQVELFLDEEERSIEDERSFSESPVEEEKKKKPRVMETTLPQKRSEAWISTCLGPEKKHWEKPGVRPKTCPLQEMSPWKEQI